MLLTNKKIINLEVLAMAITKCAIEDYKLLLKGKNIPKSHRIISKEEIERFFLSSYFDFLMTFNDG